MQGAFPPLTAYGPHSIWATLPQLCKMCPLDLGALPLVGHAIESARSGMQALGLCRAGIVPCCTRALALLHGMQAQAARLLQLVHAEGLPELLLTGAGVRRQGLARNLAHGCSEADGFG